MLRLLAYVFDFIFAVIIARLLNRVVRSWSGNRPAGGPPRQAAGREQAPIRGGETARDPVCGMFVSTELSRRLTRGSETLHFCSQECLDRYQKKLAEAGS